MDQRGFWSLADFSTIPPGRYGVTKASRDVSSCHCCLMNKTNFKGRRAPLSICTSMNILPLSRFDDSPANIYYHLHLSVPHCGFFMEKPKIKHQEKLNILLIFTESCQNLPKAWIWLF